ncbi:MAG TPA: hypothetical protein VJN93_14450 [Candidatus Acidoferrum sp.]|nr:hypothetical protein [Candidatus Acidoferrum sp.]
MFEPAESSPSPNSIQCSRDLLSRPLTATLFFCVPAIAIIVTAQHTFSSGLRAIVWTIALILLGSACLVNARRCGRTHCFLTGPFFLLMAAVTALFGFGLLRLGANGWGLLGQILLLGAILLCCVPELLLGKYRPSRSQP